MLKGVLKGVTVWHFVPGQRILQILEIGNQTRTSVWYISTSSIEATTSFTISAKWWNGFKYEIRGTFEHYSGDAPSNVGEYVGTTYFSGALSVTGSSIVNPYETETFTEGEEVEAFTEREEVEIVGFGQLIALIAIGIAVIVRKRSN